MSEFHLALAKLDVLCHKTNDCAAHIHTVNYLLSSSSTSSAMPQKTANRESLSSRSDAGDDSIEEEEKSPTSGGEFVIQSKPLDFEDVLGNDEVQEVGFELL